VGETKGSSFLRRPLSTIVEEPDMRSKRATGPQKPQISRPRANAPTNNHPVVRPQNNHPGNKVETKQQPGRNKKPNQPKVSHGHSH
jgi:hypothetical protein